MLTVEKRNINFCGDDVFIPKSNFKYYLYYIIEPNVVVYYVSEQNGQIHCSKDFSKACIYDSSLSAKIRSETLQGSYDLVFSIGVK